ncbi:MAG: uracil-DNA glycosylase [Pseudomonadota bacterium]
MAERLTPAQRVETLEAMGIRSWRGRGSGSVAAPATPKAVASVSEHIAPETSARELPGNWPELRHAVKRCTECRLHETRTQSVFGVGDDNARLMVIGEGPGAEEDRTGEPFVGRAGKMLDAMLKAINIAREQVFIANVVKCRPPQNRDPRADEVEACSGYLRAQISHVKPHLLLAVGRVAAQHLLGSTEPLGKMRGRDDLEAFGIPVIVTYHPAYLLRTPAQKGRAWIDLKRVRRALGDQA